MDRTPDPPILADLTAAEAHVLRYAPAMRLDADPLKLALQELVAGGALRVVHARARGPLRRGVRAALAAGPNAAAPVAPALAPVLALHADRAVGDEILLDDFTKAARKAFGGHSGYAEHEVAPVLEARGLLTIEPSVGVHGRSRYFRTPAGRAVDDALDGWLDAARHGASGARLREGGAAVLLLRHLHPELGAVERHLVPVFPVGAGSGIDDLGSAFAWIDVGFPAGGDGGGGNGGG